MWYIVPLLLATVILADYDVDNTNTSVVYSAIPSQSGESWKTFSVDTQSLALSISNSTGNYTIPLDASHCYDQNYALGVCGTGDNCFIEIPFTGSGITMYVFNAGFSGMTASFSVDGGAAVSNSIDAPPPPTYQTSKVSLYNIQGLQTGNHTIKMTLLDWNGSPTSMKFDYAHVNETLVTALATTSSVSAMTSTTASQTPTQTSTGIPASSHNVDVGSIVGSTLGALALLSVFVIGVLFWRRRKANSKPTAVFTPVSTFQVNPFLSEFNSPTPPYVHHESLSSQQREVSSSVLPLTRSAILRDVFAASNHPSSGPDQNSQSVESGQSSTVPQPLLLDDVDVDGHAPLSASHGTDTRSPFESPEVALRYNLTAEQVDVIDRLRLDNMPVETIARVVEGYVSSNNSSGDANNRKLDRGRSLASAAPPPSYQTQDD